MKRILSVMVVLVLLTGITACGKENQDPKMQLVLEKLILEDGTYGWNGVSLNSTVEDVEKKLGIQLDETFYDDGRYTSYIVKKNEKTMVIEYKEYRGYAGLSFVDGELADILFIFPEESPESVQDVQLQNDLNAIYAALDGDMEATFGPHQFSSENVLNDPDFKPALGWQVFQDIGNNYQSQLNLGYDNSEEKAIIINIVRLKDGKYYD